MFSGKGNTLFTFLFCSLVFEFSSFLICLSLCRIESLRRKVRTYMLFMIFVWVLLRGLILMMDMRMHAVFMYLLFYVVFYF